jgi:cyclic beta-1,2-glucan synthetase
MRAGGPVYTGLLMVVTASILAALFLLSGDRGMSMVLVAALAAWPASDIAVALVNRVVTGSVGPRALPRLDLDDTADTAVKRDRLRLCSAHLAQAGR